MRSQDLWPGLGGVRVQLHLLWQCWQRYLASCGSVLLLSEQHVWQQAGGQSGSGSGEKHRPRWVAMMMKDADASGVEGGGVGTGQPQLSCPPVFQASGLPSTRARSTRRFGGLAAPWQMQRLLTSCRFLLRRRTSCCGSTFLQKVRLWRRKQEVSLLKKITSIPYI